jgi:hypothetical protein
MDLTQIVCWIFFKLFFLKILFFCVKENEESIEK